LSVDQSSHAYLYQARSGEILEDAP